MAYYERTFRLGFGGGLTTAIKYLLIANGAVFILKMVSPGTDQLLLNWLGMRPAEVVSSFQIWQLVTYMFLHGDPWHLIINMFFLWMFGCEVERALGTREFLKYYFVCGIGAGLFHLIINFNSPVVVVGASGAIYGVMAAFAVLFPDRVITLLLFLVLPVQVKAKYLVMAFAGISLLLGAFGSNDGVAHFAHLGGMVVGFAYLRFDWRLAQIGSWLRRQQQSKKVVQGLKKQQAMHQVRQQVDEILDKINEVGYDKLSDEEKRILQDASQKFSQETEPDG